MITQAATIEKMKRNLSGAFELAYYAPGKKEPMKVQKYTGDSPEEATMVLEEELAAFEPGTRFEITVKKNAKDTNDTATSWQFRKDAAPTNPAAQFSGFGSLPAFAGLGAMIDPAELKAERERLERLKEQLHLERMTFELEKVSHKNDKERHAEKVREDKEKLAELERTYTNRAGMVQKGVMGAVETAIEAFATDGHFGKILGSRLAGLSGPQTDETDESETPEDKAVEEIAQYIDQQNLTLEELAKLMGMVKYSVKKIKEQHHGQEVSQ